MVLPLIQPLGEENIRFLFLPDQLKRLLLKHICWKRDVTEVKNVILSPQNPEIVPNTFEKALFLYNYSYILISCKISIQFKFRIILNPFYPIPSRHKTWRDGNRVSLIFQYSTLAWEKWMVIPYNPVLEWREDYFLFLPG